MLLAIVLAANLTFDFPAVQVGVAEYEQGPTGATIFYFPKTAKVAVDVRGGAPATIETDGLRLAYDEPYVDAISFAGGSSYGLAAATGAAHELKARNAAGGDWGSIASVPGAIIFDLGGRRYNTIVPDFDLGRAALRNVKAGEFPLGPRGAGRFAMQGGYYGDEGRQHSGQGGAFRQVGATKIAVFTVVNALGAVVDRGGNIVRCNEEPCGRIADKLAKRTRVAAGPDDAHPTEATTLTLVVTNQKLPFWALQRLAIHVHTSMARAIQPFHTTRDGDVLFAASTDEIENESLSVADLGVIASEVAWDAVLASVPPREVDDRPVIAVPESALQPHTGRYELAPAVIATVTREGAQLYLEVSKGSIYLPEKQRVALQPLSATEFRIPGVRRDRVRFERDGMTINPGLWPLRGKRVMNAF
ncbi:MAG TPA: P1 family peptidase [Thermoanaerobaculia bacterium]|jgi:L-aminopeptidase/D-esterase-like protein|nr:P1 family peptidase [Thermoanaerobaculia bacterium]